MPGTFLDDPGRWPTYCRRGQSKTMGSTQIWQRGPVNPFGKYSHHHPKSTNDLPYHAHRPNAEELVKTSLAAALHACRTSPNMGEELANSPTTTATSLATT